MKVNIREAKKEELLNILEIYKQPDMDNGKVLSVEQAIEIFDKISSYPNYKVFVALYHEIIVGTFALAIMDNLAHMGASSGSIEDVVVKKEYQGKGVGKQMITYAIECCKKYGCYKVALSSNLKRERAHKFYESLEFKKHGYSYLGEI